MLDLSKYANMFYEYKTVSAWSSPQLLKNKRQMPDPKAEMDVYSFGLLMWELWHEKLPFDGDIKEAIEMVLQEDQRPMIRGEGDESMILEENEENPLTKTFTEN